MAQKGLTSAWGLLIFPDSFRALTAPVGSSGKFTASPGKDIMPTALRTLLLVFALALVAHADPFEIDYIPLSGHVCPLPSICLPVNLPPLNIPLPSPFSAFFTLTSAQLNTDGTYDISSSLDQFNSRNFGIPLFSHQNLVATATTLNGAVTDVDISYGDQEFTQNPLNFDNLSFTASAGTWQEVHSLGLDPPVEDYDYAGTYSIRQIVPVFTAPEPTSITLLVFGALTIILLMGKATAKQSGT